eukprot:6551636-Pyramimonas_sp.AAC.1
MTDETTSTSTGDDDDDNDDDGVRRRWQQGGGGGWWGCLHLAEPVLCLEVLDVAPLRHEHALRALLAHLTSRATESDKQELGVYEGEGGGRRRERHSTRR